MRACRKFLALTAGRARRSTLPSVVGGQPMILSAIAERLKRRSKDDFRGRHFEAPLILQAVCWYLRYPLSYRDIEELFLERGLAVDHSTLNRWVLAKDLCGRPPRVKSAFKSEPLCRLRVCVRPVC